MCCKAWVNKLFLCKKLIANNRKVRPSVSEGSQFHQPPHVPSCNAHQDPKNSADALATSNRYKILRTLIKLAKTCDEV